MTEDKAARYFNTRLWVYFFSLAEIILVLALVQSSGIHRPFIAFLEENVPGRPLRVVSFAAAFHFVLYVVAFPQHFYRSFLLEKEFGLSAETFGRWALDEAKGGLLGLAVLSLAVVVFYGLVGHFPGHWWIGASLSWLVFSVLFARILPSLILPMFYPMKPLAAGELKDRLLALAGRFGVRARDIYEIALSRKTKKANAAVVGLGKSRRIVLGDTLLKSFDAREVEIVVGHELAHYYRKHIGQILAFHFALCTAAFFVLNRIGADLARGLNARNLADLALYPALALLAALFAAIAMPFENAFSRRLEREADRFALEAVPDPPAFISAMEKLAAQNLALKSPSRLVELVFFSHPSISRRIEMARRL